MSNVHSTAETETITAEDRDAVTRLALRAARDDFMAFIMLMDSTLSIGPHHRLIADELQDITIGKHDRLMIHVSPRSTKSVMSSIYGPAWALGKNPNWQILLISHSSDLATDWGRKIRDVINSAEFRMVFPDIAIRKDNRAADNWSITYKGKPAGSFKAAGAGQPIAGKGAHLALIDDPISEQDAWSAAKRNSVNNWYPGGLRTRLMPGGRIVLIQTRWHEEDLSGYLLTQEAENPFADQWRTVTIPALNSSESAIRLEQARDKLIRQGILSESYPHLEVGGSYWPAPADGFEFCWNTEALIRTKNNTPKSQWEALYMQSPTSEQGNILLMEYWQNWSEPDPPKCLFKIQSYDTAFSTRETADYSAVTTWGVFEHPDNGNTCLICLGGHKERLAYPDLKQLVIDKYHQHEPDVVILEKKASGQSLLQDLRIVGLPVFPYNPDRDKVTRAHAASTIFHAGRVYIPTKKEWAHDIMDECRQFPSGAHDDYVDSVTQAVLWFRASGWAEHPQDLWQSGEDYKNYERTKRRYY